MTTHTGFGKPQAKPKSTRSAQRSQAAQKYEQMKSEGMPEYEIYLRIQGKKNWYPVGVISVKRSSQINQAIFGSQTDLLQGAVRLYPILRKYQQQLEYGYRLKAYKDEPIQVAVPPAETKPGLSNLLNQAKAKVADLLQRK